MALARALFLVLVLGIIVAACGGSGRRASEPVLLGDGEPAPAARAEPAPFAGGLVPCAKDAPAGEGCAVRGVGAGKKPAGAVDSRTVWKVTVGPDDPVRGPVDALVTVVVFSDFECPFCRRSAQALERLAIDYPREVRIVWKDLPLDVHPNARAAAELARAARVQGGDPAFWAAHDRLFENQSELGDPTFRRIARELRVPWASAAAAVRAARFGGVFRASSLLADRVAVEATPTHFVNGRKLVGAQPYPDLRALVDQALGEATRLTESGTPRPEIYGRIVGGGAEVEPATGAGVPPDPPAP